MKNKDIYLGWLASYPILGDEIPSKDFMISGEVRYLPGGDQEKSEMIGDSNTSSFGGVLLKSSDVDAIEFIYYRPDESEALDSEQTASEETDAERE